MPDAIFDDPRLAAVYDPLDPDRSDLDGYVAVVDEFRARSVIDVGCGTGTLAVTLAARGVNVVRSIRPAPAWRWPAANREPNWSPGFMALRATCRHWPPISQ